MGEVALERKQGSPLRVMCKMTASDGLGLDAHYDDLPMPEVLAAWQNLPKAKKKGENKAKLMEEFMLLTDDTPPPYSLELLKQHHAFRRGDVESLSIVSWNAQLMNILDGPNEADIMTDAAQRALDTIKDVTRVKDGVPSWLRQMFQKDVKLSWSDHLPIVLTITMLKAEDEGVKESKGN